MFSFFLLLFVSWVSCQSGGCLSPDYTGGVCGCAGQAADGRYFLTAFTGSTCACGSCSKYGSYFTADKQRGWPCGTRLLVCNPSNSKCVVASVVDFGPGCRVDTDAGGPVLDASPNVCLHLFGTSSCGWSDKFSVTVQPTTLSPGIHDGASNNVPSGGNHGAGNSNGGNSNGGNSNGSPSGTTACSFEGVQGVCSVQSDCQASGKLWTSSNAGAMGCEALASNVRCCTNPQSHQPQQPQQPQPQQGPSPGPAPGPQAPSCTYRGKSGTCMDVNGDTCTGQFRSSAQGANGCQSLPSNIKCCLSSSNLFDDQYSGYVSSGMAAVGIVQPGAIAGIVIGSLFVIGVVAVLVWFIVHRASRKGAPAAVQVSNEAYTPPDRVAAAPVTAGGAQYQCAMCEKSYTNADDLAQHVAQRH